MKAFLDTCILIDIVNGMAGSAKYLESDVVILKENLSELYYYLLKSYDEKVASLFFGIFSKIAVDLPLSVIPKAMAYRYNNRKKGLSYIDCLGYTYALENSMVFVTGDRAFRGMRGVEIVR